MNIYCDCPLWPDDGMCALRACSVCECEPAEVPSAWRSQEGWAPPSAAASADAKSKAEQEEKERREKEAAAAKASGSDDSCNAALCELPTDRGGRSAGQGLAASVLCG